MIECRSEKSGPEEKDSGDNRPQKRSRKAEEMMIGDGRAMVSSADMSFISGSPVRKPSRGFFDSRLLLVMIFPSWILMEGFFRRHLDFIQFAF